MKFIASIDTVIYGVKYAQGAEIDITGWTRKQELQFLANGLISPSQISSIDLAVAIAIVGAGVSTAVDPVTDQTVVTVDTPAMSTSLATLTDVDLITAPPVDQQVLKYVSGKWVPGIGGGEPGPPGADSIVPGPPGADSIVPGPPGADSIVPGPPGADSTVPGPPGADGGGATDMDSLTDADTSTVAPTSGQTLIWDVTSGLWKPGTISGGGGATALNDLTDVDTVTVAPTNGQTMVYDSASGLWKPGTIAGGGGGGGGAASLPLDVAPTTPHAKDDEFAGVALDAKWVAGSKAFTKAVSGGWLTMRPPGTGYAFMLRQVAPTGDFSISAKLSAPLGVTASDARPGIFMAKTSMSKALVYGLGLSGGPYKGMWIEHSNYSEVADWGGYNGSWSNNQWGVFAGGAMWYRMRWVAASSTIFMDVSADGVGWVLGAMTRAFAQPDRIGICLENNSGNTSVLDVMDVDWFRVTEP